VFGPPLTDFNPAKPNTQPAQTLVNGFEPDTPPARHWHQLAAAKLAELDAQAQRIEQMKGVLHVALECGCLRLEDCAIDSKVCQS